MQPHLLKAVLFEMWKNSCAVAEMGRHGSKTLLFCVMLVLSGNVCKVFILNFFSYLFYFLVMLFIA